MNRIKAFSLSVWTIVTALAALNIIVFGVMLVAAGTELKVQYIPDDAFYYLTLSRNFSRLGVWTFDSGVSVTSGFHLLFAYLLAAIFSLLTPNVNSFVTYSIIVSVVFALAAIAVNWFWAFKYKNILFLMLFSHVITAQNFVYNAISVTEWSLTVLTASMYCVWFFTRYRQPTAHRTDFLGLFILGLLGSTARSDFGLLPFSIFVATLILPSTKPRRHFPFAVVGLVGTVAGLFVNFAHNFVFTGEFLQSSAKMKAFWSQMGAPNYYAGPVITGVIVGFTGLVLFALLIAAAILPQFIDKRNNHLADLSKISDTTANNNALSTMAIAAGLCIGGYALFYAHNAAIQPWYTANLIVPVLMLAFAISDYVAIFLHPRTKPLFALLFLVTLVFNVVKLYPLSTNKASWPHQKLMFQAGIYLNETELDCTVGAWNAGIIGYYEGGHVVNIDGLVNNDIYPYAVENSLPAYLSRKNICYILDFENMLAVASRRIRGGYDDAEFVSSLAPNLVFGHGGHKWGNFTLYRLPDVSR